ncbi:hypothetical protein SCLCIDRAFT_581013 [Scleroderma citrinum Foug A]|uniref:Uncharacterized protein n=1 Tax=Scleroderma citrinum Foug A TaxID=1036808 RepID=A0A0C3CUD4_9AGAM|nr:hypothetical protein SCLCIDRAFT_581013 [Scleroderma citrinum Foug A]
MSRRASTDRLLGDVDINPDCEQYSSSADINTFNAVLGNPERRRKIERRLLWKLDLRLSFLILVSLMNFPMRCPQTLDTRQVLHGCKDSKMILN